MFLGCENGGMVYHLLSDLGVNVIKAKRDARKGKLQANINVTNLPLQFLS